MKKIWFLILSLAYPFFGAQAVYFDSFSPKQLEGKKIAYFNGSFDPFHKGHAALIEAVIPLVDYVFVFANDNQNSTRKKNRIPKKYRQTMLDRLYAKAPRVILTHMDGYEVQQKIRAIKGLDVSALVGSDVLSGFKGYESWDDIYHRGTPLKKGEGKSSKAAMYIVNANHFFMYPRKGLPVPKTFLGKREITKIECSPINISSTDIRQRVANNLPVDHLVPKEVIAVIDEFGLYKKTAVGGEAPQKLAQSLEVKANPKG